MLENMQYMLLGILWNHGRDEAWMSRQTIRSIFQMNGGRDFSAHINFLASKSLIQVSHDEEGICYKLSGGF